ncbi:MAG: crossover junction endodeoxyribonuclease RuvC [Candidatus Thiodiazotropha sp. (ex Lucina aurantia)]|uniref:Crossover junction endodeoxyribonuclease RuvC n=1 Tax=Candidatus Thiodiazotropha taylori TaxID=2792791 RepID=A0A9E4NHR2_9GAMM|nr:crossover junction endodeoxyribonuclease RuvC [Candidatus Thiodiazotropha sp. (ex Lucina pensylvanica)]MBT3016811.1 crossover junction endodeoxyribonuclease RuvC [Candidatus Thiodiazotropha taylori]MBV2099040.1 crossover junction endodeoxyribonuclease RuvC [Candidatus Thiodiazotropha sp. (ex Codakia orbicularis)]MBV2104167.1 crossover junction endodeoxyribonuclease RuvC [Candidatus Thiodiazotropha sp. (ex Lucina aurantia)]MCG7864394.1 crossover junction endodeoxyribonuclease RuvC [Candidatus
MLRIIGIDPGSRMTGYGLIDTDGVHSVYLSHGVIKLSGEPLPPRLGEIFATISGLIQEHQPDVMAIEQVFVAKNPSSALKLGQARGAAICAAVYRGLSVAEYTPTRIKQAVVGTGRADKAQIQHMVQMILGLRQKPQADAADALAVALSHAHTHTTLMRQSGRGK